MAILNKLIHFSITATSTATCPTSNQIEKINPQGEHTITVTDFPPSHFGFGCDGQE
jgi:hypothetical protein